MPATPLLTRATTAITVSLALAASACGGSSTDRSGGTASTGADALSPTVTIEASGEPTSGGALVYGTEAETDGWNPTTARWAVSGTLIGMAVFDPLTAYDALGAAQPYLAESITSSDAFTRWTITLRAGVEFHDGSPLTSEAVKLNLEGHQSSPLTAPILALVTDIETPDELTVIVTTSSPWAAFPAVLTSQLGVVAAPSQLQADATEASTHPIGTGPFVFDEWEPDNQLVVTRNPNYWREGLPYLDRITFKPITDVSTRVAALRAGDIDITHLNNATDIADLREEAADGKVQIIQDPTEPEELFFMLNTAAAPFDDIRVRRALAHATDIDRYLDVFGAGVTRPADSVFSEDSPWYVDSDYPTYDLEAAKELVADYEADNGSLAFEITSTSKTDDREAMAMFEEMWGAAGIDVSVNYVEQSALIVAAVTGDYQIAFWRQWSSPDPDGDYLWWHSSNAKPIGDLSLNIGRVKDDAIDAALDAGRSTLDPEARKKAYADLQAAMAEYVPYIWLAHSDWTIVARNHVRGIPNGPLPSGDQALPFGGTYAGAHRLTQVWLEG